MTQGKVIKMACNISACKAACCHNAPMPHALYRKFLHKIKRTPVNITHLDPKNGVPHIMATVGKDRVCCFLEKDLTCSIYRHRPYGCKMFGTDYNALTQCKHCTEEP